MKGVDVCRIRSLQAIRRSVVSGKLTINDLSTTVLNGVLPAGNAPLVEAGRRWMDARRLALDRRDSGPRDGERQRHPRTPFVRSCRLQRLTAFSLPDS